MRLERATGWRTACAVAAFGIAAIAGACNGSVGGSGVDLTHAGACPFRTAADWQAFLEKTAERPDWETTCDDDGCNESTYQSIKTNVDGVFSSCAGLLDDNPPLSACVDRMRRFTTAWLSQHDLDSYGFSTNNATYFAAATSNDAPDGMVDPPPALLGAMPRLDDVIAASESRGFPYVVQASCLGNERLYVLSKDPLGRFDQWTLMNIVSGTNGPPLVHGRVSLLAIQKETREGMALPALRVHFRDLLVQPSPSGSYTATSDSGDNAKCYSCHPSGARTLIGVRTPSLAARPVLGELGYGSNGGPDFPFTRLTQLNDRIKSYGLADWQGTIDVAAFGPALGTSEGCTACHDGVTRGPLTVATSRKQLAARTVTELAMPPAMGPTSLVERETMNDPALDPNEVTALAAARAHGSTLVMGLEAERQPALEAYLLETRCN